jgi:excinuclease ABC subunit B
MERALEVTDRRRATQVAYNETHGITPRTIKKQVVDVMEGARAPAPGAARGKGSGGSRGGRKHIEIPHDPKALGKLITELENRMLEHAKNLEFEAAAEVRDQLQGVRQQRLLAS